MENALIGKRTIDYLGQIKEKLSIRRSLKVGLKKKAGLEKFVYVIIFIVIGFALAKVLQTYFSTEVSYAFAQIHSNFVSMFGGAASGTN